jgi:hypothetical protein
MSKFFLIVLLLIVIAISGQHYQRKSDIEIADKLMPVLIMRSESKVIDYEEIERANIVKLLKGTRELDSIIVVQLQKMP